MDLRLHGTILAGLVRVLPRRVSPKMWATIVADLAKGLSKPLPEVFNLIKKVNAEKMISWDGTEGGLGVVKSASQALVDVLNDLQEGKESTSDSLRVVVEAMMEKLGPVTIVVDEANIAFNVEPETEPAVIRETKAALQYFTTFTKQRRQGNVILVSSEHAFPFGLTRKEIGFNLNNFSGFLYAGELPPGEMLLLLEKRWGIGKHLACALVAHYGGHVWETYQALGMLCGPTSQAKRVGLDPLKSSDVQECLAWQPRADDDRARMRDVLRELAFRGFVSLLTRNDEVAEVR